MTSFAKINNLDETTFVESFIKMKPFPSDYGAYSEKAIKKMLPLMRTGKYWKANAIDKKTLQRIENIVDGVADDSITNVVLAVFVF